MDLKSLMQPCASDVRPSEAARLPMDEACLGWPEIQQPSFLPRSPAYQRPINT